jgi:Uma2 family endonuclease
MLQPTLPRRPPRVIFEVSEPGDDWELSDDQVPESRPHERRAASVFDQLDYMVERTGRDALVCRNLAIRWDEARPAIGVDPDVCLIEPTPPEGTDLESLLLWRPEHHPPLVAVEIVSASRVDKDYAQSPPKYAVNGTPELWVFDPGLVGPRGMGRRYRLQVWRREDNDDFRRVYAGDGPARSESFNAWIFVVNEGTSLRIADDQEGTSWWTTRAEAEREAKEVERRAREDAELRAERLAERLRAMGLDPDAPG